MAIATQEKGIKPITPVFPPVELKRASRVEKQIYNMIAKRCPPNTNIRYECVQFSHLRGGKMESARPDFEIRRPAHKKAVFLEITTSRLTERRDPKEKLKRTFKDAHPEGILIVLYRDELERIARRHPNELILPVPKPRNKISTGISEKFSVMSFAKNFLSNLSLAKMFQSYIIQKTNKHSGIYP